MSRTNEYKVKGGAFADPNEAINALDTLLEDVMATDAKSAYNTETERQYHSNIVGLQGCLDKILGEVKPTWNELGLDGSFALVKEEVTRDQYSRKAVFQHPVYEHVWLTTPDGKNMAEELLPFLNIDLEYKKENNAVNLSFTKVETKLNLPELKTSLKAAREDLQLVKTEVERAGSVLTTALDTVTRSTEAIREYCTANQLGFESAEGEEKAASDSGTGKKKKAKEVEAKDAQEKPSSEFESAYNESEDAVLSSVDDEQDQEELTGDDEIEDIVLDDLGDEAEDDDLISTFEDSLDDEDLDDESNFDSTVRNSSPPPLARKRS